MVSLGDWDPYLEPQFKSEYYLRLRAFLSKEYKTQTIYPDMYDIFKAFKVTPYSQTKVVIIGQDPYHQPNQANGMAFSVKEGVTIPPSLQNIFKEIQAEYGGELPNHGCLEQWAQQGVLLLNAVLTVRAGEANSHHNKGWEIFTDSVISCLSASTYPRVFMLWGKNAAEKMPLIDKTRHLVLQSAHPSPLSAHRGFFGCGHFKSANDFLIRNIISPIDWSIKSCDKETLRS